MRSWDSSRKVVAAKAELSSFFLPHRRQIRPNSSAEFTELVNSVTDFLRKGKAVAVHCRAGIGRSSMIVASALINIGLSTESAFRSIEESRGCPVPDTDEQRRWVERHSGFDSSGK